MKTTLRMALLAVPLAWLTACADDPGSRVFLRDLAQAAARQEDQVSPRELAGWLIEGRGGFELIDVRQPEDYQRGMIGEARNIPLAYLFTERALDSLPRDRKLIVYSNGSQNAAKAAVLLRLTGYNAHVLDGGYAAWHRQVLNPDIPLQAALDESPELAEQRAYACYFVGERSGTAPAPVRAEPFVPPVYVAPEGESELPPPAAVEGC